MQSAVKPLVVLAKHIFKPEAEPISSLTCLTLRRLARSEPDTGAADNLSGPDIGTDGLFQEWDEAGETAKFVESTCPAVDKAGFRDGGPPMIPPSMNLMAGAVSEMWVAIVRAV